MPRLVAPILTWGSPSVVMSSGAKTKGVAFVGVRTFVVQRFGETGWSAVLQRLEPEDRRELIGVLPIGWYSLEVYARLIRAIDELHGCGDCALIVQLGRFEAERDLALIERSYQRLS